MNLSYKLDNLLRDELKPGERLLWCGQPDPWRVARQRIGLFLFGVIFLGIVLFGIVRVNNLDVSGLKDLAPDTFFFYVLCFSPFIVIFLLLLLSPLWQVSKASKTVYAITSNRAIILEPKRSGSGFLTTGRILVQIPKHNHSLTLRSFTPNILHDIERVQRANGSGDLLFANEIHRGAKHNTYYVPVGFYGVPDVREVERILTVMRDENLRVSNPGKEVTANP